MDRRPHKESELLTNQEDSGDAGARHVCGGHSMTGPAGVTRSVQRVGAVGPGGTVPPPGYELGSCLSPCPPWADEEITHLGTRMRLRVCPPFPLLDVAHWLQDARPAAGERHHDTAKSEGGAADDDCRPQVGRVTPNPGG